MTKKEIVKILMRRDGITEDEALELIDTTQEEIDDALEQGLLDAVDDIILDNLGLEPDYVMAFLG